MSLSVSFGAGNFLCIAAADLIPEVEQTADTPRGWMHGACFGLGLALSLVLRLMLHGGA